MGAGGQVTKGRGGNSSEGYKRKSRSRSRATRASTGPGSRSRAPRASTGIRSRRRSTTRSLDQLIHLPPGAQIHPTEQGAEEPVFKGAGADRGGQAVGDCGAS